MEFGPNDLLARVWATVPDQTIWAYAVYCRLGVEPYDLLASGDTTRGKDDAVLLATMAAGRLRRQALLRAQTEEEFSV